MVLIIRNTTEIRNRGKNNLGLSLKNQPASKKTGKQTKTYLGMLDSVPVSVGVIYAPALNTNQESRMLALVRYL